MEGGQRNSGNSDGDAGNPIRHPQNRHSSVVAIGRKKTQSSANHVKLDTPPKSAAVARRDVPAQLVDRDKHQQDRHERPAAADRNARLSEITRRERRIDRIEAGKSAHWRTDLRISQSANVLILVVAGGFLMWRDWSWTALAPACIFAVGGMWAVALRMRPREARLCRHMMFLARHRRRCAMCRYCIQGIDSDRCPECGFEFDIKDNRHLLIPWLAKTYSRQGRQVGAIAIVAVMIGMTLITHRATWQFFSLWSLGLLLACHALYVAWMQSASSASGVKSLANDQAVAKRVLKFQYLALLLRWAFLTALVMGIHLNLTVGNAWILTRFGKTGAIASIVARLSIWVVTVAFVAGTLGRRIRQAAIIAVVRPN